MEAMIIVLSVVGWVYMAVGLVYLWMARYEIAEAKHSESGFDTFKYAVYVAATWPWIKIPKGGE